MAKKKSIAFPTLSKAERKAASANIAKHFGHSDHASDEQRIAIGLREVAPEKYRAFDERRKRQKNSK